MAITAPNQRVIFIASVVFLVISAMAPSHWARRISYLPRTIVITFTQPFTDFLGDYATSAARPDRNQIDYGTEDEQRRLLESMQQENEFLYAHLTRLQKEINSFRFLSEEAKKYYITAVESNLMPARVTGSKDKKLSISSGKAKGIHEGLVATSGPHLVGEIVEAGPSYATIRLITAPGAELGVRIVDTRRWQFNDDDPSASIRENLDRIHAGEREARIKINDDGTRFTVERPKGENIPIDSLVVLQDPTWPHESQGLFVGTITEIIDLPEDPQNFNLVFIEPIESLEYLDDVLIVMPPGTE